MAKPAEAPIVFVSPKKRQFLRSKRANRKIFEFLEKAGVVNQYGDFLAAPSSRNLSRFEDLTSREATKANLQAHFQNQIQAHLSARLPLPPGYRQEAVSKISRKLTNKLAWEVTNNLTSDYRATRRTVGASGQPLTPQQCLPIAKARARAKAASVLSSLTTLTATFKDPQEIEALFEEAFSNHDPAAVLDLQDDVLKLTREAAERAVDEASVFEARLEASEEEGLRLNVFEAGTFRSGETVYEAVEASARIEHDLDNVSEVLIEDVNLEFDLSAYGISRFGEREARETSRWFAMLLRKPERAALHFIAPPLERILYKNWKPLWLRTLERTQTPVGTRKLIEQKLWSVVRNRILTIPVFITEDGRRFAMFAQARDPKTGKKKTYFTPTAFFAGAYKKGRHGLASLLGKWAAKKPGSLFRQDFAKILGRHLRRKKKDGKDDKSTTLWWLAKGVGKALWVVAKVPLRGLHRLLGSPLTKVQIWTVNKWYAIETGGGFWGGALRFLRYGRYWGEAFVGSIKSGLGYGLAGYLITGSPYGAGAFGLFGLAGKTLINLAANPAFMAAAGQPGFNGALASFFQGFNAPVYGLVEGAAVATGETFSLLHFPVVGPTIGSVIGFIIGAHYGHPYLGARLGWGGGFVAEYGAKVGFLALKHIAIPKLLGAVPVLQKLAFLEKLAFLGHWKAGLVGFGAGYIGGKLLGLPEWACLGLGVGGYVLFSAAAAGIGHLFGLLAAKVTGIALLQKIFGFVGHHIIPAIIGFIKGFGLAFGWAAQAGLPLETCIVLGIVGGLIGAGVAIGISYFVFEKLLFGFLIKGIIWPIIVGLVKGTLPAVIFAMKTSLWAALFNLSLLLKSMATGLAALVTSSLLASIGLVVLFVTIIALVVMSGLVQFEELQHLQPGPSQSRYLSITKTADKLQDIEKGDILTYTITYQTKDMAVENAVLTDLISFANPDAFLSWLDSRFNSGKGYKIIEEPVPYRIKLSSGPESVWLEWELGDLPAGHSGYIVYQVKVSDGYEETMPIGDTPNPICNTADISGTADGHDDTAKVTRCVNSPGPGGGLGSAVLREVAGKLVDCLEPNADGVYNQYDENCYYFNTCLAAKGIFQTSVEDYGHVTCVKFVVAALTCAGFSPAPNFPPGQNGDAYQWYDAAHEDANFWTYPNESWALNQIGVGDIIAFTGGKDGFGHIGIIAGIDPGSGKITYYHANTVVPKNGVSNFENGKYHAVNPIYEVIGFIHPAQ